MKKIKKIQIITQFINDFSLKFFNLKKIDKDFFLDKYSNNKKLKKYIGIINKKFNIDIDFQKFIKEPTINNIITQIKEIALERSGLKNAYAIQKTKNKRYYKLSHAQRRMFVLYKLEPKSLFYNINRIIEIEGGLNIQILKKAFNLIVRRHEIFRTNFKEIDGDVVQVINNVKDLRFKIYDLRSIKDDDKKKNREEKIIKQEIEKLFKLETDNLFRIVIVKKSKYKYTLIIAMHHIISDRWSFEVFFNELATIYNALLNNKKLNLPKLDIQYKDYAEWEQSEECIKRFKKQEKYWLKILSGDLPVLNLPVDRPRSVIQTYNGNTEKIIIKKKTAELLKELSGQTDTTFFMLLFTIFNVFLYRITGQNDIIVGTPVANRNYKDTQNAIGLFLNNLSIRSRFSNNLKFTDLLKKTKEQIIKATENGEYPFEKLIEKLNFNRDMSQSPIFNVMFLTDFKNLEINKFNNLKLKFRSRINNTAQFDLKMQVTENQQNMILLFLEYNTHLFKKETVKKFLELIDNLISDVSKNPEKKISELNILSAEEKNKLIYKFNNTKRDFPKDKNICKLFEEQVRKTPNKIAVEFKEKQLTYKELNEKANQLAYCLRKYGIGPEKKVALLMENSCELLINILGIFKAGGAYLPISLDHPVERIKFILQDSEAEILLTNSQIINNLFFVESQENKKQNIDEIIFTLNGNKKNKIKIISYDKLFSVLVQESSFDLKNNINFDNLAYIIYTSGSTGKPKGVQITHRGMLNHILTKIKVCKIKKEDILCFSLQYIYVASNWQLLTPLILGCKLIIFPQSVISNPPELLNEVIKKDIAILHLTPSSFNNFLNNEIVNNSHKKFKKLRYIILGGENLSSSLVEKFYSKYKKVKLLHIYGQSECSDATLHYGVKRNVDYKIVPVGLPANNTQIYILDQNMELLPCGIPGELYQSGDCLSRGYLNLPQKTKKVFLPHPFYSGKKIYKTGDIARINDEGNVEIIGRIDHQIQIRGQRVELGEIEINIKRYNNIKDVVVVAKKEKIKCPNENDSLISSLQYADKYLIAYYTTNNKKSISSQILKKYLKVILPEYMIPSFFIYLQKMPLNQSGKLDRLSLPLPTEKDLDKNKYVGPKTKTEKQLVKIWQEVLNIQKIGLNDHFFNLGGHSLKAISVLAKINKEFKIDIGLKDLFKNPVLNELVSVVEAENKKENKVLPVIIHRVKEKEYYKSSYAQSRMFVLYKLEPESSFYNINNIREIKGKLDIKILDNALSILINRHEVFRTNFKEINGEPMQIISEAKDLRFKPVPRSFSVVGIYDLRKLKNVEVKNKKKEEIIKRITQKPFKLETDQLIRVGVIKETEENNTLIITMHHIISDGWSMNIFYKELFVIYNALLNNQKIELPELSIQYKDYAEWEQSEKNKNRLAVQEKYWLKEFRGELPILNLPTDKPRSTIHTYSGGAEEIKLNKEIVGKLKELSRKKDTTLFTLLFIIFNIFLHKITGQDDLIVGTPSTDRNYQEIQNNIGLFVNTLALRSKIDDNYTFDRLLFLLKDKFLKLLDNKEYPFEYLVEKLNPERDTSRNPLFNAIFQIFELRNRQNNTGTLGNAKINFKSGTNNITKLDIHFKVIETLDKELILNCGYNMDLFKRETIHGFLNIFKIITDNILIDQKVKIKDIKAVSREDQKKLKEINNTKVNYPKNKTLDKLFEKQVKKTPKNIAIEFGNQELTYKKLNEEANKIANYLIKEKETKIGDVVAIILKRNIEAIISILGILKAGGTYLPIDPNYPKKRIEYMLNNSNANILLLNSKFKNLCNFTGGKNLNKVIIDNKELFINQSILDPKTRVKEKDLAYVIYTSGSTGDPKGVMIEHKAILNTLYWLEDYFKLKNSDVVAQKTALSFTDSVWEIFWPLINGKKLSIFSDEVVRRPQLFIEQLNDKKITYTQFVPALMTIFIEQAKISCGNKKDKILPYLKYIFNGGEALPPALANKWYMVFPNVKIANIYGMTESAIYATNYIVPKISDNTKISVPLGRPISNEEIYILDKNNKILPIGISGEIAISGTSLARGYLNNKKMTGKSFIRTRVDDRTEKTLYKTGDMGKIDHESNLQYLGRVDHQVQIRGYRVEIGEIEANMRRHKDINQCAVVVKLSDEGANELYGFYTSQNKIKKEDIREYLKKYLPNYMIPTYFKQLKEFPLNVHGKIDRKILKQYKKENNTLNNKQKPKTEIEKKLMNIWKEVLEIKEVNRSDSFFDLGGHSLSAIKVLYKINLEFDIDLSFSELFNYFILSELAQKIEDILFKESLKSI